MAMKTYYVYEWELNEPEPTPGCPAETQCKEVVLLTDIEPVLDRGVEEARSARLELEAIRVMLDAYPNESAVAAALRARNERKAFQMAALDESVVE